jgi:hypothetical protein
VPRVTALPGANFPGKLPAIKVHYVRERGERREGEVKNQAHSQHQPYFTPQLLDNYCRYTVPYTANDRPVRIQYK